MKSPTTRRGTLPNALSFSRWRRSGLGRSGLGRSAHGRSHLGRLALGHSVLRMLFAVAIIGGMSVLGSLSGSSPAEAAGTCSDGAGVAVVVDLTDLGGKVVVGCASGSPETGRAALLAAGFTATDSQPGLICAINDSPSPCPESFDGSFWAYWHSTPDGEWTSYQVGADSSTPVQGEIEGWRYNEGTIPPGIAPAAVASTLDAAEPSPAPTTDLPNRSAEAHSKDSTELLVATIGFAALVAVVVILFVVRRRRSDSDSNNPEVH